MPICPIRMEAEIIALPLSETRGKEAQRWYDEQVSLITSATENRKKEIENNLKESYDSKKEAILHDISKKFHKLMKENDKSIRQYIEQNPEAEKIATFLTEQYLPKKAKSSKASKDIKDPFMEDFELLNLQLNVNGVNLEKRTIWSDGVLMHEGKFFKPNEEIGIKNRLNQVQYMKIVRITKLQMLLDLNGEKLIITPNDLETEKYSIKWD